VYTFSLEDVAAEFPDFAKEHVHLALSRQVSKGEIQSVWRGFYAVILHEFGLKGDVPPIEYIAGELLAGAMRAEIKFKQTLLYPRAGTKSKGFPSDPKWKITANKEVLLSWVCQ
jgi:predicted transcriptional regulator of viral defense system